MRKALTDGSALRKFADIIEAQDGDPGVCGDPGRLGRTREEALVLAPKDGFVSRIRPRRVAFAAIEVGAGRRVKEDEIDHTTGVLLKAKQGDKVAKGQPIAVLHHNGNGADEALRLLDEAFEIAEAEPTKSALVIGRM
jgi:pyrimidine-nucleoside phosphorylase